MKKILLLSSLFTVVTLIGQENNSNEVDKKSFDINIGVNKPMSTLTKGYSTSMVNFYHINLGGRYMFNNKAGLRLGLNMDKFSSNVTNYSYTTNFININAQAILNARNILEFNSFSDKIGLLVHFGAGAGAYLGERNIDNKKVKDLVIEGMFGFTPLFKLNEKITLNADLTFNGSLLGNKTFDMQSALANSGFDYKYATASIGLTFYLGKGAKHNDWVVNSKFDNSKLVELENRVVAATQVLPVAENGTNPKVVKNEYPTSSIINNQVDNTNKTTADADKDGIADYLDKEPNSAEGAKVDKNGVTIK